MDSSRFDEAGLCWDKARPGGAPREDQAGGALNRAGAFLGGARGIGLVAASHRAHGPRSGSESATATSVAAMRGIGAMDRTASAARLSASAPG
jgi:hypothetical protein